MKSSSRLKWALRTNGSRLCPHGYDLSKAAFLAEEPLPLIVHSCCCYSISASAYSAPGHDSSILLAIPPLLSSAILSYKPPHNLNSKSNHQLSLADYNLRCSSGVQIKEFLTKNIYSDNFACCFPGRGHSATCYIASHYLYIYDT